MRPSDVAPRHLAGGPAPDTRLAGIAFMCAAPVLLSMVDATAKWLGQHVDPLLVMWARYAGNFVFACFFINPWRTPGVWRTRRPVLQIVRGLLLVFCTIANFIALQYIQLDQMVAIVFSMPFFVALMAGPLLGETIGWRRWAAILVGFVGVIVVAHPTAGIHPALLLVLAGAVSYACYAVTTRLLAATDSTETTMFYAAAVGLVVSSVPLPLVWTVPQDPLVIGNLAMVGIYGFLGHLLLVLAHRRAPAGVLAPFTYTQIIWATLWGFLVFGQLPTLWTSAGGAIVIASGLYLINRERIERAERALEATLAD